MEKARSIIISIPVALLMFKLIISIIFVKLGKKDNLMRKYLIENEDILAVGELVYTKNMIHAFVLFMIGIVLSILFAMLHRFFYSFVAIIYFFMFSAFNIINSYVKQKTSKLLITNKRLMLFYGTFSNNVVDFSLDKISNITFHQSLLGRIFNYSKISIISTGGSKLNIGYGDLELKNAESFIKAFTLAKSQTIS